MGADTFQIRKEEKDPTENKLKHEWLNVIFVGTSILTYLLYMTTGLLLSIQYFQSSHISWAALTLLCVIIPSVIIQLCSLRWYIADGNMPLWRNITIHAFQLQPLERYLYLLVTGLESCTTTSAADHELYVDQQNDICLLRLLAAFLGSTPQIAIQSYILICTQQANWITDITVYVSLAALVTSVAAYCHTLYKHHHQSALHVSTVILPVCWHVLLVLARLATFVMFAAVYQLWIFVALGVHYVAMLSWILLQQTDFCQYYFEECLFDSIIAVIYCYCFFSVKSGPTRWRLITYYSIILLESLALIGASYPFIHQHNFGIDKDVYTISICTAYVSGLLCMMLYYRFCHPNGPIHMMTTGSLRISKCKSGTYNVRTATTECATTTPPMKRTSTSTLLMKNFFNYTSTPVPVVFEEVCTPSQLLDNNHKNIPTNDEGASFLEQYPHLKHSTYNHLDDSCAYQHYSINASECMDNTQSILNIPGIDLSRENGLDQITPFNVDDTENLYQKIDFIDDTNNDSMQNTSTNTTQPPTLVHITDVEL